MYMLKTQNQVKQHVWHLTLDRPGQNCWPGDLETNLWTNVIQFNLHSCAFCEVSIGRILSPVAHTVAVVMRFLLAGYCPYLLTLWLLLCSTQADTLIRYSQTCAPFALCFSSRDSARPTYMQLHRCSKRVHNEVSYVSVNTVSQVG